MKVSHSCREHGFAECANEVLALIVDNGEDVSYNLSYFHTAGFALTRCYDSAKEI